ncbi:hypothetical protein BO94DRAFT_556622 [Aspergillus sclerotioniger CBS 115572]|uniref:Zn(II)2Cys6 transcription factor n=1 Tax=Aspergillus sclerotioniger CBS 115572 TaxID=1450535 RepID=A0A317WKT2_9EURO|nr:hypothetical protein BO94DRAFT_556622 [Aspergillus sclerotioniger CBS 115572]PWY87106.1 hypothetical protein BO94DRAFT_556622 [Aspergillus sclerotioniger CBS 115572]
MPSRRDPWYAQPGDDNRPSCARCQTTGRNCVRSQSQFQFLNSTSAEYEQTAANRPSPSKTDTSVCSDVEHVDETPALAALYHQDPPPLLPQATPRSQSTAYTFSLSTPGHLWDTSSPASPTSLTSIPPPPAQLTLEEACLLRYFAEALGKWFDLCDPQRHFTTVVPQRARTCPPLLDAVLSASARHFSTLPSPKQVEITRKYGLQDGLTITEQSTLLYHNRCIAHLRSVSEEPNAMMDENLLAAVVTLRFYEELDTPFHPSPPTTAIHGLQIFLEAQSHHPTINNPHPWTLRQSAFWIGIRQEFHMAFSQQRPFRLPLSLSILSSYPVPTPSTPDHIRVNSLLILCAEIIHHETKRMDILLPPSFIPVYTTPGNIKEGLFPNKWYMDECHIVAAQSLCFVRILLGAFNPRLLGLSLGNGIGMEAAAEEVRDAVWEVCGIGVSNRWNPTGMLIAAFAVVVCAERFRGRKRQQEVLMGVVREMREERNYWPGVEMEKRVRDVWDNN